MTKIAARPHYPKVQSDADRLIQRRFDDLKTLIFALVVCAPIATVVGMVIGDWFMIGLALFISSACGMAGLYLLRKLETTVLDK